MKQLSTTKQTVALYLEHVWRYKRLVIGIFTVLPLSILAEQYLNSIILADVLGRLAKGQFRPDHIWADFGGSILAYGGLMLLGSVGWRIVDLFNWKLEGNVMRDMAQRIYNHLLEQSANFHANRFGGSLVSQTNKFMGSYIRAADTIIYQTLQLVSGLIFATIILATRAPLYAALLFIFSIGYMASGFFVTRKVREMGAVHATKESKQTGYLADSVTNIMAIKSFAGGRHERQRFGELTEDTRGHLLKVMTATQKQMAYFSLLNRVILVLSLVMAVISVVHFKANISTVFLIFSYTGGLVGQLWTFCNNSLRNFNRSFGDASDMTAILQLESEVKDPAEPETPQITNGAIAFEHVDFTHDGAGNSIFKDLNIAIKAGEKVGLVGHSGSGKTTLTRLLLRFSDINGGAITIDGQNIAHLTQDDLRKHIAYVPQEPIMFHRSLMENISYGQLGADDTAIFAAAKGAHASEFIKELPEGYETLVGERGVKLSGGQRQRIAIARAMLKNAPILLLDEATSALDSESELLIQDALWTLMENRTAIVIAHRLSTIQKMDRIIVLDNGKVVEEGSHAQLLKKNKIYAKLWKHQSGGFIDE